MNNHDHERMFHKKHSFKDFVPLLVIFALIIFLTALKSLWHYTFIPYNIMQDFMGIFFVVFGLFKIINLHAFAQAYAQYDLIAKRSEHYALAYPFIEFFLGIIYLTHQANAAVLDFTLVLMLVNAIGVAYELRKGSDIQCACLGTIFKIPMTYVTLLEDILMASMVAVMIFFKR